MTKALRAVAAMVSVCGCGCERQRQNQKQTCRHRHRNRQTNRQTDRERVFTARVCACARGGCEGVSVRWVFVEPGALMHQM